MVKHSYNVLKAVKNSGDCSQVSVEQISAIVLACFKNRSSVSVVQTNTFGIVWMGISWTESLRKSGRKDIRNSSAAKAWLQSICSSGNTAVKQLLVVLESTVL